MKFFIYNPEPLDNFPHPACYRFHSETGCPVHNIDCYREVERLPLYFQCTDRVLKLSEPNPRHQTKKFEKELLPFSKTSIIKKVNVSTRLEHLAAPTFRRAFTARQNVESRRNVKDYIKQNLNMQIQKSMYSIYSRLENVKFPKIPEEPRKQLKLSAEDFEKRLEAIKRLSEPRKIKVPEEERHDEPTYEKRPIDMTVIERLSIPRKIKSPEDIKYTFPSRPLKGPEYYYELSKPRKIVEETVVDEPKLKSMKRTIEIAAPLPRLQRRKFMKGDNDKFRFQVSRAALQYQPSAKIIKLAKPRIYPEDENQGRSKGKNKK